MAHFIKLDGDDKETVLNLDLIWKIEVTYVKQPLPKNPEFPIPQNREAAKGDPDAIRNYRVYIGNQVIDVPANPDNNISNYLEAIYQHS